MVIVVAPGFSPSPKMPLFVISSCVHRPCGDHDSCAPLLLDHTDMVNCTSHGPGHMECAITCQRGFVLQTSSGKYLRPIQVSWKHMVIETQALGKEAL